MSALVPSLACWWWCVGVGDCRRQFMGRFMGRLGRSVGCVQVSHPCFGERPRTLYLLPPTLSPSAVGAVLGGVVSIASAGHYAATPSSLSLSAHCVSSLVSKYKKQRDAEQTDGGSKYASSGLRVYNDRSGSKRRRDPRVVHAYTTASCGPHAPFSL